MQSSVAEAVLMLAIKMVTSGEVIATSVQGGRVSRAGDFASVPLRVSMERYIDVH
jgi:hypothetical protein